MPIQPLIPPAQAPDHGGNLSQKLYRAGTLRYTLRGLIVLSLWLLGGDFAFTFFESIFMRFIPLYLKDLQASNTLIGVMTGSIAGLVNFFFLPNISQWSDHYRSRWGRRIPFLYVVTPLTVGSLVAIGFAPEIAGWLRLHLPLGWGSPLSAAGLVLTLLCCFVVSFHFFNMVLIFAYNCLLRDVVPQEVIARFLSWFRFVGSIGSFIFLRYVFPHLVLHRKEAFMLIGLGYLAVFLLMALNVKEGGYPAPPPKEERPKLLAAFLLFFRECLSLSIYRNYFIVNVLFVLATSCAGPFSILFTRDTLHLDMGAMGAILAWGAAASALFYFPVGWLCDRFSPLHVTLAALVGIMAISMAAYFLVNSEERFLIYTGISSVVFVGWGLGAAATAMRLFPKEKFGQFFSGINIFCCGALIFGNFLIGKIMDVFHSNYRITFLWSALFFALAIYPLLIVFREWKRHGGAQHYVAPLPMES